MLKFVILNLIFLCAISATVFCHKNKTSTNNKMCKKSLPFLMFSRKTQFWKTRQKPNCNWLKGCKTQKAMCLRRKGFPNVLWELRKLAVSQCEEQFRYDQWNCPNNKVFFKDIYAETAYMQAMSSAAMMYTIARSCSEGTLPDCPCGPKPNSETKGEWVHGGCADNIRFARRFTTRTFKNSFVSLKQLRITSIHNMKVGVNVAVRNQETKCQCHGVSKSCTIKTCWKRIGNFQKIADQLKNLYYNALYLEPSNYLRKPKGTLTYETKTKENYEQLHYLKHSPNFCHSTRGRHCTDTDNCATLCCGRGFYLENLQITKPCDCRWRNEKVNVECDNCTTYEDFNTCK